MNSNLGKALGLMIAYLGAIFFLNWSFSFSSDDCFYALGTALSPNGIPEHLGSLSNAWMANWNDGYRPIVHLFVRIFTGCFDKWVFNIANTAMMGLLVLCIYRLAKKRWAIEFNALAWLLVLVFLVLCKGEAYLWCSGSVNYLWAGTGSIAFCLIVERLERQEDSWWQVGVYCILALLAGWLQEAFVLPICAALIAYYIFNYKTITVKKVLVLLAYAIGVWLLVRIAGQRASTIPTFSVATICMTLLKIAVAIKAVWVLLIVFAVCKDKRDFMRRNLFLLLVVGASISMIALIGFNGERSIWAANLFAIVILVREFQPSNLTGNILSTILAVILAICGCLGYKIRCEFDDFTAAYLKSDIGFCWHERVNCGPFARFFHQCIYRWEDGGHGKSYAYFYGRDIAPVAFSKAEYAALYTGSFYVDWDRLPIPEVESYTTADSNTIVIPLPDGATQFTYAEVEYDMPKGFVAKVKHEIAIRKNPPLATANIPRVVDINGKRLALIAKLPECDNYIRAIRLE